MEGDQLSAQAEGMEQVQQAAQPEAPASEGIQKRIDQLTAMIHEERKQKDELTKQVLEMSLRQSLQPTHGNPPTPEPDPFQPYKEQVDPKVMEMVAAATAAIQRKAEAALAAQQAAFAAQLGELQLQTVAAAEGDIPDAVKQQAAALLKQHPGTDPKVALEVAYGRHALQEARKTRSVQGYRAPSTPVLTGGGVPPPRAAKAPPANFDNLSPDQQVAWYEANGYGDEPL